MQVLKETSAFCVCAYVCVCMCMRVYVSVKQDKDGWTPLHFAARFNNVDVLMQLLKSDADPNIQDRDGWTAMHNSA